MTAIPAQQTAVGGPIGDYIRALLTQLHADAQARQSRIEALENTGHRIIDGGRIYPAGWEVIDWRTREVIASGDGDIDAYNKAVAGIDGSDRWVHIDRIDDEDSPTVPAGGIPESLADALQDWLSMASTSDQDVAAVIGWSVDEVAQHRGTA